MTIQSIEDSIVQLSLLEAAELVHRLEGRLGVSAQQTQAQSVVFPSTEKEPVAEEATEFTVMLTSTGETKINVIKAIREITALGLKEAKDMSENLPKNIKSELSRAEAEAVAKKLRDAGATVEIK